MFAAPNSSSIMGSVPAKHRGAASGMRSTFQNSGTALSIGVFFSLMIAGLASTLPQSLTSGLVRQGVPHGVAAHVGSLPPVSSLFAAVLGVNPIEHLLSTAGALASLPAAAQRVLTGREFFPQLISAPFHHGLTVVFAVAAGLAALAAVASLLRGGRYVHPELESERPATTSSTAGATGTTSSNGATITTSGGSNGVTTSGGSNDNTNAKEEHDGPDHPGRPAGPGRDRPAERDHRPARDSSPR
jgi:hypothetical protein